jgi:type IV pilus assembly protein PilQ
VGLALLSVGAQRVLALELSALEADGRGRVVSSPRVVTADRVKALIEQGMELPYQAKIGDSESAVQFRRAGLKLEVTPQITPSGHVMLELDITKDTVGANTQSGPAINTKHVHTQVQVENGGTVAIGGIYIQDERDDVAAVPGLGALPLVGALFRRHSASRTKSELMVFITPNVVAGPPGTGSARAFPRVPSPPTDGLNDAHSTKPVDSSLIPPT